MAVKFVNSKYEEKKKKLIKNINIGEVEEQNEYVILSASRDDKDIVVYEKDKKL